MKKNILWAALMLPLAACSSYPHSGEKMPKIGMSNPASQYCVEQKGKLEIRNGPEGQTGYCHLPNGQVVEEWALFRSQQKNCMPDEAQKLVGQSGLTDEQIKQVSRAQIVRNIAPGQPVTMDYRENRVTVVTDPSTKKIVKVSCG